MAEEVGGMKGQDPQRLFDSLSSGSLSFDAGQILSPSSERARSLTGLEILQPLGILLYHAIDACVAARLQSPQKSVLHQAAGEPSGDG